MRYLPNKSGRKHHAKVLTVTMPTSLFSHLNDRELLSETIVAAKVEKAATLKLLDYLYEIDLRRLYAHHHYGSLFEYVVKELKFSEPAASERVSAVRLMCSVPETKPLLANGSLTLTNAAQIQRYIKTEEKVSNKKISVTEKQRVVNACLNQSKRAVEKMLFANQSEPAKIRSQEKIKSVNELSTELKFIVQDSVIQKISDLKDLIGEKSLAEIFELGLDAVLFHEKKKRGQTQQPAPEKQKILKTQPAGNSPPLTKQVHKVSTVPAAKSRFIPINFKRVIYARSQGRCEYMNTATHKRCEGKYRLQIDHVKPLALGGLTELENLRHLCQAHNLRAAKEMGIGLK